MPRPRARSRRSRSSSSGRPGSTSRWSPRSPTTSSTSSAGSRRGRRCRSRPGRRFPTRPACAPASTRASRLRRFRTRARCPRSGTTGSKLKEGLGVDWDILAFCTRDVVLPDGTLYGTLCLHHREERTFSDDEQALLEVLARMLGLEIWRERAARELVDALAAYDDAERRRVELADELQHELRAPLQVIDGYAEAMLDGVIARDDEHMTLVRGRPAARSSCSRTSPTSFASSSTRRTRTPSRWPPTPWRPRCASGSRRSPRPRASSSSPRRCPRRSRSRRRRLEQLFVNLVRNALRAVHAGGGSRITIFVRPDGGLIELGVEDDGPGMAPDQLPRAFERFYRGSSDPRSRRRKRARPDDRPPDRRGRRRRDRRRAVSPTGSVSSPGCRAAGGSVRRRARPRLRRRRASRRSIPTARRPP